jgi:hypothetical protein
MSDPTIEQRLDDLRASADALNAASDELTVQAERINEALARIGLGVSGWVSSQATKEFEVFLGYCRFNKRWSIGVKEVRGKEVSVWPMAEAPRWMRETSMNKLPILISHLEERAREMTKVLQLRAQEAKVLADIMQAKVGIE